ncbi:DUF1592 domain-containing protein [Thalassoglobus sp.]|uniref:DUF1592 domain-containing protein n=1 Tax=Thalassoglobus sp. TaxID=2795869 RepID=UPI003AA87123
MKIILMSVWFVSCHCHSVIAADSPKLPGDMGKFVENHCVACHEGEAAEAGLDLTKLNGQLENQETLARWIRIFDRVHNGEMPPKESNDITGAELKQFLNQSGKWLNDFQKERWSKIGRVQGRRLTNLQLERSLHQLLGVDLPLESLMPEEQRTAGFTTVANGQPMSHFQLEEHLKVVDAALDNAFQRAILKDDLFKKSFDAKALVRTNPKRRTREPELIDGFAVTWSSRLIFYGRIPATTARKDGWYRFTIRAKSLNTPKDHGVWCTVRTGKCVSSAPLLNWVGALEATDRVQEWTFETWLPRGDMLEVRPGDDTLKMGRFQGGQVGTGEGGPQNLPGVAIESIVMEEVHYGQDDEGIRKTLFGDLKVKTNGKDWQQAQLQSANHKADAKRLMLRFAERAFRHPVDEEDVQPFINLVFNELDAKRPLLPALRTGYRALLCSPRFLYFEETPGQLDDYAIASRLSYFLWNSPPDEELLKLADSKMLNSQAEIRQQVRRMLNDPQGKNFVKDFADQWLDLSEIDFTTPDRRLYPGFDVIVQQSMLSETETYLEEMIRKNLSVSLLIDSKYTYLNERLARFYGIKNVSSDQMQRVSLKPEDHRGGLLTHGAILKVTANGTTTSPVLRGVWVSERLLGIEIPPPPAGIAAIEPDIRGAKTIREMLEKHKSNTACASCHVNIDPPGFALENFDPAGRWRERYIKIEGRKRVPGNPIDASHELPSGEKFKDIKQFRSIVAAKPAELAKNVAEKLVSYGTGAPITFADRTQIEEIVAHTSKNNYGFRSIIEEVAASELFRTK